MAYIQARFGMNCSASSTSTVSYILQQYLPLFLSFDPPAFETTCTLKNCITIPYNPPNQLFHTTQLQILASYLDVSQKTHDHCCKIIFFNIYFFQYFGNNAKFSKFSSKPNFIIVLITVDIDGVLKGFSKTFLNNVILINFQPSILLSLSMYYSFKLNKISIQKKYNSGSCMNCCLIFY